MVTAGPLPPLKLCLSGGGVKALAHIGAMEVLKERGLLGAVKEYIGVSAGALCAFCMCLGCSLSELRMIVEMMDFSQLRHLEPETLMQFPDVYGMDTGDNLMKLLTAILRAKNLSPSITFEELGRLKIGPRLRVYATDLNLCRAVELSESTEPGLEVRLALKASMSIPLYFQPVRHPASGHLLVDGGVVSHSPLRFLSQEEKDVTLSITFSDKHKVSEEIVGFLPYLKQLYYALHYESHQELHGGPYEERTIFLDCGNFNSLNFEMGLEDKIGLMRAGRKSAELFLESYKKHRRVAGRRASWNGELATNNRSMQ